MGRLIDRLFDSGYYDAVCQDFSDASTKYAKGLSAFIQIKSNQIPKDEYKYKQFVHEYIEHIKHYDRIITAAINISERYPKGVLEFRTRNRINFEDNTFITLESIYKNEKEIIQYDKVLNHFMFLYAEYSAAINLMVGTNPTFEKKQYIVNNTNEVAKIQDYLRYYTRVKSKFPNAVKSYVEGRHDLKTLISFSESTSEGLLEIVEEYVKAKNTYTPAGFQVILGRFSDPAPKDYSPQAITARKAILSQHAAFQANLQKQQRIESAIREYRFPITLRFGKRPSLLSTSEKDQILNILNDLALVQLQYFNVSKESFWLFESNESFIDYLIRNAEAGKKYILPRDPEDLRMTALFENSLPRNKTTLRKIYPELPDMDDFSPKALSFRKNYLSYFLSTYGIKDDGCRYNLDSSRDPLLRELFRFPDYGEGKKVNFDDSYSIQKCYELQMVFEKNKTTFKECFDSVKKNYKAIRDYNKATTGEETWYIEDLIKIARKDPVFIGHIEKTNQELEIRNIVINIKKNAPLGFAEYCKRLVGFDIDSSSVSVLQQIISDKETISELQIQEKAKALMRRYADAIAERFGSLSTYCLPQSTAKEICNCESSLITRQCIIDNKKAFEKRVQNATHGWEQIAGLPYYFFYWYYPTRFTDITDESKRIRNMIYSFKNGSSHTKVAELVRTKIQTTFTSSDIMDFTFVCIPASTKSANIARYESFAEDVCNSLGMKNAFPHIRIVKEKMPSRLGGEESAEYDFDRSFFSEAKIILFDDIVTRGSSMRMFKDLFAKMNATIVCALSIGRTYSDFYSNERKPHPSTGLL